MDIPRIQYLIFLLCWNVVEPRWRPVTRPRAQQAKVFPNDIDKTQLAQLKLPNKVFCAEMEKKIAGVYILMPWWYHYCQDLKEQRAKSFRGNDAFYKPIYKSILDQVVRRRRREQNEAQDRHITWLKRRL